eukprot:g10805.t1
MQWKDEICGAREDPVSEQLALFAADFESKILRPVRERRAAGDEVLAIHPVALGVVRDPEWEGVVDGEVCGLGPLADIVKTFLHWVPIKLDAREALRLCASCGDGLAREGEFACAREFYNFVFKSCERLERETDESRTYAGEASTCMVLDETCWVARARFGAACMELRLILARDPHVQFPATLTKVVVHLRGIQNGMRLLLDLPKEEHDDVSWLVLEGCVLLFDWCEPLTVLGHGDVVAEFLVWSTLAMESMVSLSTVKHLPWRTRLAVATCYAFEDAGKPGASAKCANHALEKARELRRQEGMDPPIPTHVLRTLDAAEADLSLLCFKYAALSAAVAQRPQPIPGETGEREGVGGSSSGANGAEGAEGGGEVEGGLSEDEIFGLLEQHIPDAGNRPAALLELLGRAPRGSHSAADTGSLTAREASAACKCAVSLLNPPLAEEAGGVEEGGEAGEEAVGGGEIGDKEDVGDDGSAFPLDMDQEMQLMREIYRLGEFEAWEGMLPSTKQRLRDASHKSSLNREDIRSFWFEIALWSSCKRLATWRDKPEPPQPASRGGLKKTPKTESGDASTSPTATGNNGNAPAPSDAAANSEGDGSPAEAPDPPKPSSQVDEGRRRGAPVGKPKSVAGMDTENELREYLLATRLAEVVEIQLEGAGSPGVRVNLSPMLTVVGLLRKALFGPYRHVLERRGEALIDVALSLWEPYVASILKALDGMPAEVEVDLPLLDALLLSLETISACLSALNADDESLRATVALRLAVLQADFRGDRRKACQTLRGALAGIDRHRQSLISHHLHHATAIDEVNSCTGTPERSQRQNRIRLALGRASITAAFHPHQGSSTTGSCGGDADDDLGQGEVVADMGFHELAALQLEITSTLFRIELLMGRDVASQLGKHQKTEAAARLAARKDASKRRKSSKKSSKVTFGDSEGRSDALAGSLVNGWSVMLPAYGRSSDNNATKALTGTNAVVCAAGAGPLPTKAAAAVEAARQNGMNLTHAGSTAVAGVGSSDGDAQVCVYGKPEGAGTGVTLCNTHFAGLGVPIPFDETTGVCGAVTVRGLTPNASYVFAVAAFDEHGEPIGEGMGDACKPVEALNPLPLPLCWAQLSRTALGLGFSSLAAQAATEVYQDLMISGAVVTAASGGQPGRTRALEWTGDAGEPQGGRGITTDLRDGWMANPLLGQAFHPEALDRCPRGMLQAFVQACFVLVDTSDREAMTKADTGGGCPLEEQVCRLICLKRLSLGCEVAVLLQDWDLVARGVWKAYHLLLPLLRISAMGRLVFQLLCELHQCLSLVPKGGVWDAATKTTFACLGYQITIKGHEIGEDKVASAALLDHGPEPECLLSSEAVVFKDSSREEEAGEHIAEEAEGDEQTREGDSNHAQLALLEMWMGLPGYGPTRGRAAEVEVAAALSRLRKALGIAEDPAACSLGEGRSAEERAEEMAPATTLQMVEKMMPAASEDPSKGWELLRAPALTSHPDRPRLLCRVCWMALERGMAEQVVTWIAPTTAAGSGAAETSAEVGEGRPYFLAESDLKPLASKVLALEGVPTEIPYISPAPAQLKAATKSEEDQGGDHGVDSGSTTWKSDDMRDGEEQPGQEQEDCLDHVAKVASSAESDQLLRLAEVEHVLGAACLQLGLAAAAEVRTQRVTQSAGSSPREPASEAAERKPVGDAFRGAAASKATVAEAAALAAGGRMTWGFGAGPFAEVFATKSEIFSGVGDSGGEHGDGELGGVDDNAIISQLEDDGTPWPSMDEVVSAVAKAASNTKSANDVTTPGEGEDGEEGDGGAGGGFAVLLSKAMLHLARAASRAKWGRSWGKTERSCGLLWNAILSLWLSPQDFRPTDVGEGVDNGEGEDGWDLPLGESHGRIYAKACEALLDAVDATHENGGGGSCGSRGAEMGGRGRSDSGSNPDNAGDTSGHLQGIERKELKPGENIEGSGGELAPPDTRWVSRFVEWGLQGILRCRCWGVVVKVGSKLLASRAGLEGGHRVYPLVLFAQKRLCALASTLLSRREARLAEMEEQFQAAQAKRRRRKVDRVLKALETKSKEEIEHERAREPFVEAIGDARVRKQIHDHRLGTLLQSRDTYVKTKKIGRRVLDEARESLSEHLALLSPPPPDAVTTMRRPSAPTGLPDYPDSGSNAVSEEGLTVGSGGSERAGAEKRASREEIEQSHKTVLKLYGRTVEVLRDKRERELLAEALCDVGDLHDSTKHWRKIFQGLRAAHPSTGGPPGGGGSLALALGGWSCLAGGIVVAKLSTFTGQRECDYASYTPDTLGGPGLDGLGLWADDRRLSAAALSQCLMHVQGVLVAAGRHKEAFPVQAVLEHVASSVTLDPLQLVRVRLARTECLAEAGFPAEAASALAGVLSGKSTPKTTGGYAGRRDTSSTARKSTDAPAAEVPEVGKGKEKKGSGAKGKTASNAPAVDESPDSNGVGEGEDACDLRDLAESGLPFYGFAPYHNNLPLGHPDNAAAVSWMIGDSATGESTGETAAGDGAGGKTGLQSRHGRLLKRGLFGINPTLEELHGENEACLLARARARLLLTLADCSAMLPSEGVEDGTECVGEDRADGTEALRRVRDAADCILGEVLQVVLKRISPAAIPAPAAPLLDTGRSGKSSGTHASAISTSDNSMDSCVKAEAVAAAEAEFIASTAPDEVDGWSPPMAADALLMRGRLALLDGKLRAAVTEGELEQAVTECHSLAVDYMNDESSSTLDLAAVLRLLAKIRRQQSLVGGGSDRRHILELLSESLEALRLADRALLTAAKSLGWMGSGLLTYVRRDDNVMGEDAKPHLLHALGTSFGHLRHHIPGEFAFGFAPADERDDVAQSSLANLYLPALRLLLTVRVSLLDTLEGIGPNNTKLQELERCRILAGSTWFEKPSTDGKIEDDDFGETAQRKKPDDDWLVEASSIAEETLALLRHIAHPHPALRAHLLLIVGKLRLRRLQGCIQASTSSDAPADTAGVDCSIEIGAPKHGSSLTTREPAKAAILGRRLAAAARAALTAALRVSFARGGHDWGLLSSGSMSLVVLYLTTAANSNGEGKGIGEDGQEIAAREGTADNTAGTCSELEHDLGLACHFLQLAASISAGRRRLDMELDKIASEPLPPAVVESLPRSALDELAGRGGRGPEDDPLRLTARVLLQFLRARGREKSLAAAPADLLPASMVCQTLAGNSLSPGTVCVQWIWADIGDSRCDGDNLFAVGAGSGEGGEFDGLYPTRIAYILLGAPPAVDGEGNGGRKRKDVYNDETTMVRGAHVSVCNMLAEDAKSMFDNIAKTVMDSIWEAFREKPKATLEERRNKDVADTTALRRSFLDSDLMKGAKRDAQEAKRGDNHAHRPPLCATESTGCSHRSRTQISTGASSGQVGRRLGDSQYRPPKGTS